MVRHQLPAAPFHPAPSIPPAVHVLVAFAAMLALALVTSVAGSAVALTLLEHGEHPLERSERLFDGIDDDEPTLAATSSVR